MLKELLKNTRFRSEIKKFYKKNIADILDILIFGSAVKGKLHPKDIDMLLVFRNKTKIDLEYELRKQLEKLNLKIKFEITPQTYSGLFNTQFLARESILSEAYSIIHNCSFAKSFGYQSYEMFMYNLTSLTASQKMMFNYALYGRNSCTGLLKTLEGIKLSKSVVLIPINKSSETIDFLNGWKIKYNHARILIPERAVRLKEI